MKSILKNSGLLLFLIFSVTVVAEKDILEVAPFLEDISQSVYQYKSDFFHSVAGIVSKPAISLNKLTLEKIFCLAISR